MAKRSCINGHVTKGNKALKCSQCGVDLPPVPKRSKLPLILGILGVLFICGIIGALSGGDEDNAPTASQKSTPVAEQQASPDAITKAQKATEPPAATRTSAPSRTPKPTQTPIPTKTKGPTATPRPTHTPEPTPGVEARLLNIARLENATASVAGGLAKVEYDLTTLTERLAVMDFVVRFAEYARKAFGVAPEIDYLTMTGKAPLIDKYGNETLEPVMRFTISREVANKINWDNMLNKSIGPLISGEPGCKVFVHPALQASYLEYISE